MFAAVCSVAAIRRVAAAVTAGGIAAFFFFLGVFLLLFFSAGDADLGRPPLFLGVVDGLGCRLRLGVEALGEVPDAVANAACVRDTASTSPNAVLIS